MTNQWSTWRIKVKSIVTALSVKEMTRFGHCCRGGHCITVSYLPLFVFFCIYFCILWSFIPSIQKNMKEKKKKGKKAQPGPSCYDETSRTIFTRHDCKNTSKHRIFFLNMCLIIFNVDQLHCIWHKAFSSRYCNAWQKELTVLSLKVGRPYLCIKKSS